MNISYKPKILRRADTQHSVLSNKTQKFGDYKIKITNLVNKEASSPHILE